MSKHFINIKSIQEWHGGFEKETIGKDMQMELEFLDERSISYTCDCGEKFYKREKAEEHLLENE